MADKEYIERKAVRDMLYEADAITMSGVAILNNFPTADVVEVRHGEWGWYPNRIDRQELLCTNCEEPAPYNEDGERVRTSYCPNCGAKMDGKGD